MHLDLVVCVFLSNISLFCSVPLFVTLSSHYCLDTAMDLFNVQTCFRSGSVSQTGELIWQSLCSLKAVLFTGGREVGREEGE